MQTIDNLNDTTGVSMPPPLDCVIVGAGFGGLGMAIQLRQQGLDNFVVLEKSAELGGVWHENTYPGCGCDVPSYLYSFSFAPYPWWSRDFASREEIQLYMKYCAERFALGNHLRFNSTVTQAIYREERGIWQIETAQGHRYEARFLATATGGLSLPVTPTITGLDCFGGRIVHTARWSPDIKLTGKRIGVIGTGASAIQLIPEIAPLAAHTTVFQRTAPWVLPKDDRAISAARMRLMARFPILQNIKRWWIYWSLEWHATGFVVRPDIMKLAAKDALRYLRKQVKDPELLDKVTPRYELGCKRVLLSNSYLTTLGRDDVTLETTGIEAVTAAGIRLQDGREVPLDILVTATGFQAAEASAPFLVEGRNGLSLADAWKNGAEAFLGTAVSGFPNLFLIVGPNTALGHSSMIFMIESQINLILSAMQKVRSSQARSIEVRESVMADYNQEIKQRLDKSIWKSGCQSWYQTRNGKITTLWPGFTVEFRRRTRAARDADFQVTP